MPDKFRKLCFTLRKYDHTPTQWLKLDDIAKRFYCSSMRAAFTEFQLCSGNDLTTTLGRKVSSLPYLLSHPDATKHLVQYTNATKRLREIFGEVPTPHINQS